MNLINFLIGYVNNNVCETSLAIESQGFTIITSGEKDITPIKGEGSLKYFPQLEDIKKYGDGLINNLSTVINTHHNEFSQYVDFIDTPGLVDGNISYPFDVNEVINYFADYCDLIFVFFDPHGQALCNRTMNVLDMLKEKHSNKLKFYLTKIDEIDNLYDLIKISQQLTQNLCPHVCNTHGWEVPPIFIPKEKEDKDKKYLQFQEVNQIKDVCETIRKSVDQKVLFKI